MSPSQHPQRCVCRCMRSTGRSQVRVRAISLCTLNFSFTTGGYGHNYNDFTSELEGESIHICHKQTAGTGGNETLRKASASEQSQASLESPQINSLRERKGFPGGTSGKEPACQCRRCKRLSLIPGLGRSPRGGHGSPLQYSCLENPRDRGA